MSFSPPQMEEINGMAQLIVNVALENFQAHRTAIDLTYTELQAVRVAAETAFAGVGQKANDFDVAVSAAHTELQEKVNQLTEQQQKIITHLEAQSVADRLDFESITELEDGLLKYTKNQKT